MQGPSLERNIPMPQFWQPKDWKALWQKRIWESWWTQNWAWPSKAPLSKEGQQLPGLHWEEHCQQAQEGDSPPLVSTGETHEECLVQFRAPQHRTDMDELERDQQRATEMKGMEHLTCEPSQKARSVQPGEERLRGRSYLHFKDRKSVV